MIDQKTIADPKTHYGSPRAATRSFIAQRLTGMLNVLFLMFFVWLVVRLAGAGRAEMVAVIAHPVVAIVLAALLVNVLAHMRIGMREIVDDYVHDPRLHRLSFTINEIFVLGVGLVTLGSLVKLVFWG